MLSSLRVQRATNINLACYNKLLPHYTKGTPSQFRIALTAYMSANSGSISPVIYLLFILSFTVLFTIAKHAILNLEDGSPLYPVINQYV